MTGLEQHHDRDPLFIEFVRLPVDKQRDMLRKWLKFFQRMLPKKVSAKSLNNALNFSKIIIHFGSTNGMKRAWTAPEVMRK